MTTLRRVAWRHPHWWAIGLCAAAWGWLVVRAWNGDGQGHEADASAPHGHGFALIDWALMIVTMMLPLVFDHLRVAAARSLWPRRHRAMLGFLCGYAAIWLLAGVLLSIAIAGIGWLSPPLPPFASPVVSAVASHDVLHDTRDHAHRGAAGAPWIAPWIAAAAFLGAAAWQLSPLKRRALIACHRTLPLAPRGWRAHRDCLRYGWIIGCSCLWSCALLMIACAVAGHSLPVMLTATGITAAERVSARADGWTTSAVLALVAAAQWL